MCDETVREDMKLNEPPTKDEIDSYPPTLRKQKKTVLAPTEDDYKKLIF